MLQKDIIDTVVPVLKQHGVIHASIFGSFVRGEQRPDSDIDILVQLPREMTLLGKGGLYMDLKDALHRNIDIVEYDFIKPSLRENILGEKVDII